jgi:hypothetical protein
MHGWQDGRRGALLMGAKHGLFCLGCCWGIMAVLFVVGLMNLGWMAALSLLIVAEKLAPRGLTIGRASGAVLIGLGVVMALQPGLFPAAGLSMSGDSATMPTMSGMRTATAPMVGPVSYRAMAGPYTLTLTLGPPEAMLTPAEAQRTHARSGEVMLDDVMPVAMRLAGMHHYLELRVTAAAKGMAMHTAMTDTRVIASVQGAGTPHGLLTLVRMYNAKEGKKDLHYGANVNLEQGAYTIRVRVHGYAATFHVRVA